MKVVEGSLSVSFLAESEDGYKINGHLDLSTGMLYWHYVGLMSAEEYMSAKGVVLAELRKALDTMPGGEAAAETSPTEHVSNPQDALRMMASLDEAAGILQRASESAGFGCKSVTLDCEDLRSAISKVCGVRNWLGWLRDVTPEPQSELPACGILGCPCTTVIPDTASELRKALDTMPGGEAAAETSPTGFEQYATLPASEYAQVTGGRAGTLTTEPGCDPKLVVTYTESYLQRVQRLLDKEIRDNERLARLRRREIKGQFRDGASPRAVADSGTRLSDALWKRCLYMELKERIVALGEGDSMMPR